MSMFDLFAVPVINFNMRGKEKVTSKLGQIFSVALVITMVYFTLTRSLQILRSGRIETMENLDHS